MQAETATLDQLGTARKITIRANETTIIADAANREEIDIRVAQARELCRFTCASCCRLGSSYSCCNVSSCSSLGMFPFSF